VSLQGTVGKVVGFKENGRIRVDFENGKTFAFKPDDLIKVDRETESEPGVAMQEGWVKHEVNKKDWTPRWWVLRGDCLRVYESQDAAKSESAPLHALPIASCTLRQPKSTRKGRPGALRIDVKGDALKLIVDVGSAEARRQWQTLLTWTSVQLPPVRSAAAKNWQKARPVLGGPGAGGKNTVQMQARQSDHDNHNHSEPQINGSLGAKNELLVEIDTVNFRVTHETLRNLAAMQYWYSNIELWKKFRGLRPIQTDIVGGARLWWQYAVKCVMGQHLNAAQLVIRLIKESREYSELFKRKFADGRPWLQPLSESEVQRCLELEEALPMHMITSRRKQAWLQLHQEEEGKDHSKRDFLEMQSDILGVGADSWTDSQVDTVVDSRWLLSEKSETKTPKKRWVIIVDAQRFVSTTFSGWGLLRHDKKEDVWDRLWFRLKGEVLTIFAYPDDRTPKRQLEVSQCSMVSTEATDTKVVRIEIDSKKLLIKCDTSQESKSWVTHLCAILEHANTPTVRMHRWVVIYKTPTDSKPVDAIPLAKGTFTMVAPTRVLKKIPFAVVITATLLDLSVKECLVAAESSEELTPWSAILAADSAEVAHITDRKTPAKAQSLSANQQAMIKNALIKQVSLDELNDDESDEDEDDSDVSIAVLNYFVNRVEVKLGGASVTVGTQTYDWVTMQLNSSRSVVSNTTQGVSHIQLKIQDAVVNDDYSRDTCYPQLMFRSQSSGVPVLWVQASTCAAGHRERLNGDEDASNGETSIWLKLQPMNFICNPALVPALAGFVMLSDDDGVVDVRKRVEEKLYEMRKSKFFADRMGALARDRPDAKTKLYLTIDVGCMQMILPSDFSVNSGSAPTSVVAFEKLTISSAILNSHNSGSSSPGEQQLDVNNPTSYDEFQATVVNLEVYCCDRNSFTKFHEVVTANSSQSTASSKRYLLRPIMLPARVRVDKFVRMGYAEDVDRVGIYVGVESLTLELTTAVLRECGGVLSASLSTMWRQRKGISHMFGSTLQEKTRQRFRNASNPKDSIAAAMVGILSEGSHVKRTLKTLSDSGCFQSENAKAATLRFELVISSVAIAVEGPPIKTKNDAETVEDGPPERLFFVQTNEIKACFAGRPDETWVSGSFASFCAQTPGQKYQLACPAGFAKITSVDQYGDPQIYLYDLRTPDRLLACYGLRDILQVVPREEIHRIIPFLYIGLRVGGVIDGVIKLSGVTRDPIFPQRWQDSIAGLVEATGMGPARDYIPHMPGVVQTLAQYALDGEKMEALQSVASSTMELAVSKSSLMPGITINSKGASVTGVNKFAVLGAGISHLAGNGDIAEGVRSSGKGMRDGAKVVLGGLNSQFSERITALTSLLDSKVADSGTAGRLLRSVLAAVTNINLDPADPATLTFEQTIAPLLSEIDREIEEKVALLRQNATVPATSQAMDHTIACSDGTSLDLNNLPNADESTISIAMLMAVRDRVFELQAMARTTPRLPRSLAAHRRTDITACLQKLGYADADDAYIDGLMAEFADCENGKALSDDAFVLLQLFLRCGATGELEPSVVATSGADQAAGAPTDGGDVALYKSLYYAGADKRASDEIGMVEVARLVEIGTIDDHTLVFADGMEGWTSFSDCKYDFDWP
jgi:hypothetical protein